VNLVFIWRFIQIMAFGSKYFGWLSAMAIVLAAGWFLLPAGYNTLIQWMAPQLGNYVRPTLVMVNILLVNPLTNIVMVGIWGAAGFVGGLLAGTKKGAFVVGFMTWLFCVGLAGFCVIQMFISGFNLGNIPPLPPGSSIVDVLSIPIIKDVIGGILPMIAGISGGGLDILSMIVPLVLWVVVPIVVVIVAGIIGAMVRPKE
jgi:hypothetical protein